jgi:hypothetical protein
MAAVRKIRGLCKKCRHYFQAILLRANELVMFEELLLSDTVSVDSCWISIDHGELLSFADGPSRPEHGRSAVRNDVHVGITAVIHQTASQAEALSYWF